jgi:hypothetical protein
VTRKQPRVVAHITGLGGEYSEECLRRAQWWADDIFFAPSSDYYELPSGSPVGPNFVLSSDRSVTVNPLTGVPGQDGYWWQTCWDYFAPQMGLRHGDWVFMLTDSQIVVEHQLVKKMVRENPGTAIGSEVLMFYDEDHYRVDGQYRPYFSYQLFPYKKDAVPHEAYMPAVPTYVYSLPYRNDPHLTIADYRHFGNGEGDMMLREWKSVVARA